MFGTAFGHQALKQINMRGSVVGPGSSVPVRLLYVGWPSKEVTIPVQ
jgi:hypothetical protein